jgi:hypothetical protein
MSPPPPKIIELATALGTAAKQTAKIWTIFDLNGHKKLLQSESCYCRCTVNNVADIYFFINIFFCYFVRELKMLLNKTIVDL